MKNLNPSAWRLIVLFVWSFVTCAVFVDYLVMDVFDLAILTVLAFLILLVALSLNPQWKFIMLFVLAVIGFGFAFSLDPVMRSLIQHKERFIGNDQIDGAKSYYNTIRCFRPYGILSIGGLLVMAISALKIVSRSEQNPN